MSSAFLFRPNGAPQASPRQRPGSWSTHHPGALKGRPNRRIITRGPFRRLARPFRASVIVVPAFLGRCPRLGLMPPLWGFGIFLGRCPVLALMPPLWGFGESLPFRP